MKKEITPEQLERRKKINKRIIIGFGVFVLLFILVGIFGGDTQEAKTPEPEKADMQQFADILADEKIEELGLTKPAEAPPPVVKPMPDKAKLDQYVKKALDKKIDGEFRLGTRVTNYEYQMIQVDAKIYDIEISEAAEGITRTIVQLTLDWLMQNGFEPQDEEFIVVSDLLFDDKSPSGKPLTYTWGYSRYSPALDEIMWVPVKK